MAEEWEEYLDEASGDLYYSNGVVTTWDIADTLTTPTQPTPSPLPQSLIEAAPTEAQIELPHDELNQPKEPKEEEEAEEITSPTIQSETLLTEKLLENKLTEEKEDALVPEDITTDTHTIERKRPQSFIVQNQVLTSAKAKLKSNIITQEEYLQIVQSQEIHDLVDSAPLLGSNNLSHDKEQEDMERIANGALRIKKLKCSKLCSLYTSVVIIVKNYFLFVHS